MGRPTLITWLMVGTSIPRAATSVATSTRNSRRRKPIKVRLRLPCGMPPCKAATAWPSSANWYAICSASICVLANTTAWSTVASAKRCSNKAARCIGWSAQCRRCSIWAFCTESLTTSMRCGSFNSSRARLPTRPSKVALNITVWRSFGSMAAMASMSSMKPRSSMRSASSSTSVLISVSMAGTWPAMSCKRPGVAITKSAPKRRRCSCAW